MRIVITGGAGFLGQRLARPGHQPPAPGRQPLHLGVGDPGRQFGADALESGAQSQEAVGAVKRESRW